VAGGSVAGGSVAGGSVAGGSAAGVCPAGTTGALVSDSPLSGQYIISIISIISTITPNAIHARVVIVYEAK